MRDMVTEPTPAGEPQRRALPLAVVVLAALAQLAVLVPFTVASGLVAPPWAVLALHALWLAGAAALVALARRRPLLAPAVPLANAVALWLAVTLGEVLLGWTA